jgi:hypothetical protein
MSSTVSEAKHQTGAHLLDQIGDSGLCFRDTDWHADQLPELTRIVLNACNKAGVRMVTLSRLLA